MRLLISNGTRCAMKLWRTGKIVSDSWSFVESFELLPPQIYGKHFQVANILFALLHFDGLLLLHTNHFVVRANWFALYGSCWNGVRIPMREHKNEEDGKKIVKNGEERNQLNRHSQMLLVYLEGTSIPYRKMCFLVRVHQNTHSICSGRSKWRNWTKRRIWAKHKRLLGLQPNETNWKR